MRNILNLTLILLFALARVGGLWSQTLVTNDITTNTTWALSGSPFLVANDISIDAGAILSIESGVEVRVSSAVELEVKGTLLALGSESDSIAFRADVMTSLWSGIAISGNPGSRVELSHCTFSEGKISAPASSGDDVLAITNCSFKNCAIALAELPRQIVPVSYSLFEGNNVAVDGANLAFLHCDFNRNGTGIRSAEVLLSECTFNKHTLAALDNCSGQAANCSFFYNPVALRSFGSSAQDTVYNCSFALNDTALIASSPAPHFLKNEFCGNGLAVAVQTPANLSLAGNCWCTQNAAAIDQQIWDGQDQSGLGLVSYLPLDDCDYPGLVWPGDADDNGVAEIVDVLSIGVAFGSQGGSRPNATQVWAPQPGVPWGLSFDSGVDFIHADCDGNGIVNASDIPLVLSNFGETHQKRSNASASGAAICLEYPDSAGPGDTIRVDIYIGDSLLPAADLHGLAISLAYDRSVIDSASIGTSLRSNWLGSNLLDVAYSETRFHWAVSRTDQQDTLSFGRMGGVDMIMIDDLARTVPLVITVDEAYQMDQNGKVTALSIGNCGGNAARLGNGLSSYPNPANDKVTIGWEDYEVEEIEVYGPGGQLMTRCVGMSGEQMDIATDTYQPGIYIVRARLRNGLLTKKITIIR